MGNFILVDVETPGSETRTIKGINPMLITHFETVPQGGALLFMMGGAQVALSPTQWGSVGNLLAPPPEPSQAPKPQV